MLLYLSTEIDTEQSEKERKIIIKNQRRQEACGFCLYSSGFGSGQVKNTGNVLLCPVVVKFSRTVCCILLM